MVSFVLLNCTASWSSDNAFVNRARVLKFKYRTGQIGHDIANGLPPLRHCFESSKLCCPGTITRRCAPSTRYKLRRNTASTMKDLILVYSNICTTYYSSLHQKQHDSVLLGLKRCFLLVFSYFENIFC